MRPLVRWCYYFCVSRISGLVASPRMARQMSTSRASRGRPTSNQIGLVITTTLFAVTLLLHLTSTHGLADCDVLVAMGWAPSAGWIVNATNPSWCCANQNGITCNLNLTRVEQLILPGLGLQGTIYASIRIVHLAGRTKVEPCPHDV